MAVKPSYRMQLDPIVCDGHGVCAELFPERITLDDWGYPIIDGTPVDPALLAHARRAVEACPVLALRLERALAVVATTKQRRRPPGLGGVDAGSCG